MESKVCQKCNAENSVYSSFCSSCGTLLETPKAEVEIGGDLLSEPPQPKTNVDEQALRQLQAQMALQSRLKNGASWLYWVAGLSILNTVVFNLGINIHFTFGLAISQFVDGFAYAFAQDLPEAALLLKGIGFVINLLLAGFFVLLGVFASKGHRWIFIVSMVIYALDTVLLLLFQDWLGFAFHLLVMVGLFNGFKACGEIQKVKRLFSPA